MSHYAASDPFFNRLAEIQFFRHSSGLIALARHFANTITYSVCSAGGRGLVAQAFLPVWFLGPKQIKPHRQECLCHNAAPSSWAVRTSIPRMRNGVVTARRTWTSMYSDRLNAIASDRSTYAEMWDQKPGPQARWPPPIHA